jgi:capsular polysaccharide biosynthesis protein
MVEDVHSTEQPVSLSISSSVILYTIIGFVLACGLFTALHLVNNTFRSEYDIRQSFDIPVLSVIPAVKAVSRRKRNSEVNWNEENDKASFCSADYRRCSL